MQEEVENRTLTLVVSGTKFTGRMFKAGAFGMDRTLYVLANTVRHKDWDGRISHDNKASLRHCPKYTNTSSGMIAHLYYILSCVRESYHHPITRIDMCLSCTFER